VGPTQALQLRIAIRLGDLSGTITTCGLPLMLTMLRHTPELCTLQCLPRRLPYAAWLDFHSANAVMLRCRWEHGMTFATAHGRSVILGWHAGATDPQKPANGKRRKAAQPVDPSPAYRLSSTSSSS